MQESQPLKRAKKNQEAPKQVSMQVQEDEPEPRKKSKPSKKNRQDPAIAAPSEKPHAAAAAEHTPEQKQQYWGQDWGGRNWGYWYSQDASRGWGSGDHYWSRPANAGSGEKWVWDYSANDWRSVLMRPSTRDLFDDTPTPPTKPSRTPDKSSSGSSTRKLREEGHSAGDEAKEQEDDEEKKEKEANRLKAHAKYMRFYRSLEGWKLSYVYFKNNHSLHV